MKKNTSSMHAAQKYLQSTLYSTAIGDRLPSIRQMVQASGASRKALEFYLKEYADRQLIECRRRIGIIRSGGHGKKIYDIVACHESGYINDPCPNFLTDSVQLLLSTGAEKNFHLRIHSVPLGDSLEHYVKIAKLTDSDGFILLAPNMIELISLFQRTQRPVVAVYPEGVFPSVDQIFTATGSMEMQLKHLYDLGHRYILYMREEYPYNHIMTLLGRRLDYYRFMARKHLPVPEHWCSEYKYGELEKALQKTFSQAPCPTGLIIYDRSVKTVYNFLRKNNLKIGKDVSILATDGDKHLSELNPPVTTVVSHALHTVHAIWALLEKQERGDHTPRQLEVMLTFRQGRSDGPPPGNMLQPISFCEESPAGQ